MPPAVPTTAESLPLRDIHLPPAISWWPPAPGWWLLLVAGLLLIAGGVWFRRRRQLRHYRRLLLSQLQVLEVEYRQQVDEQKLLQELSRLLRQAAQLHFPARNCSGLVCDDWLDFLDQTLGGKDFSQGCGRALALGPYLRQAPEFDATALLALCRRWLGRLPPAPKVQGGRG